MNAFPDSHKELLEGTPTGVLATKGPDGFPQVSAIWFVLDGGEIMFSSPFSRQKVKNLQKRSKCTLVVLDLSNPNRYIEIRGRATVLDDSERPIVERLGEIYGSDLRAWDKPGDRRASVSITPVRIRAVDVS